MLYVKDMSVVRSRSRPSCCQLGDIAERIDLIAAIEVESIDAA